MPTPKAANPHQPAFGIPKVNLPFSGIVKGDGKPVPFAEIEVEYLNYDVDVKNNKMGEKAHYEAPQDSFVTLTIKADENGKFTFGIPKADRKSVV